MSTLGRILRRVFRPAEEAWQFGDFLLTRDRLICPGEPGRQVVLALSEIRMVTYRNFNAFPILIRYGERSIELDMGEDSFTFYRAIGSVAPHVTLAHANKLTGVMDISLPDEDE